MRGVIWIVLLFAVAVVAATTLGTNDGLVTPVSYTHLRAHETVLDLVCRLLLEKNKYKVPETVLADLQLP